MFTYECIHLSAKIYCPEHVRYSSWFLKCRGGNGMRAYKWNNVNSGEIDHFSVETKIQNSVWTVRCTIKYTYIIVIRRVTDTVQLIFNSMKFHRPQPSNKTINVHTISNWNSMRLPNDIYIALEFRYKVENFPKNYYCRPENLLCSLVCCPPTRCALHCNVTFCMHFLLYRHHHMKYVNVKCGNRCVAWLLQSVQKKFANQVRAVSGMYTYLLIHKLCTSVGKQFIDWWRHHIYVAFQFFHLNWKRRKTKHFVGCIDCFAHFYTSIKDTDTDFLSVEWQHFYYDTHR